MESEERNTDNKDSGVEDDKSEFRDQQASADNVKPEDGHKEDKEDVVESDDEGSQGRETLKPAFALFWAMRKLKSLPAGANKETIADVLSTRFEHKQDPNFEKKVETVLAHGVQFGMLEQCGDRYCLNKNYNKEMSRRDRVARMLRLKNVPEASHTNSMPTRSRSTYRSQSSESSSDEMEGVEVIEWAIKKLNDRRGSSQRSIKRMVGTKYKRTSNFDQLVTEALDDAMEARKVKRDGNRYRLII